MQLVPTPLVYTVLEKIQLNTVRIQQNEIKITQDKRNLSNTVFNCRNV